MKDYNKFAYISDTMDTRGVCWGLGWWYLIDQSANRTRKRTEEVEFDIGFTEVQDVHIRRETVKVSLKMLKLYCYESRGCILSRSSDTWAYERREFGISAYFSSTSKSICVKFPAAPKLQITSNNIVFSFSLQPLRTPGFKKCSSFKIEMLLLQPLANFYSGGFGGFSKSWLTTVFGLVALQVFCAR